MAVAHKKWIHFTYTRRNVHTICVWLQVYDQPIADFYSTLFKIVWKMYSRCRTVKKIVTSRTLYSMIKWKIPKNPPHEVTQVIQQIMTTPLIYYFFYLKYCGNCNGLRSMGSSFFEQENSCTHHHSNHYIKKINLIIKIIFSPSYLHGQYKNFTLIIFCHFFGYFYRTALSSSFSVPRYPKLWTTQPLLWIIFAYNKYY